MKLLLTSKGGFPNQDLVTACSDLVGKPVEDISFAVINEAYSVMGNDKRWVAMQLNAIATKFGGTMDIVNLRALDLDQIEQRLIAADAVYCVGGHTDFLMRTVLDSGLDRIISGVLDKKVWVGSSAGSMILGHRTPIVASETELTDGNDYGISKYLELVDFGICPHTDRKGYPSSIQEMESIYGAQPEVPIYGLADDSAVLVDGDQISVIGSKPIIFSGNT